MGIDKIAMNIIIFTNHYPIEGAKPSTTYIVRYYAESFVKHGHNVIVVNSTSRFPYVFYLLPKKIVEIIENKLGYILPDLFSRKSIVSKFNGVNYLQLPVKKIFPGKDVRSSSLFSNYRKIYDFMNKLNFVPDIAVGHWCFPQIHYLKKIKEDFNCRTSVILHSVPTEAELVGIKSNLPYIDNIGFRNESLLKITKGLLDLDSKRLFLNYSGVSDLSNLASLPYERKHIDKRIIKICFVGSLIFRKYPHSIVQAVQNIKNVEFQIDFVGDGTLKEKILASNDSKNVFINIHGRLSRTETYKILAESDLFIMISKHEAFGLAYLEAMLNRNIPIAAYGEGFDGIIEDQKNGYLCEAGNVKMLEYIIMDIINSPLEKLYSMQKEAFLTAVNMTDDKMAEKYIMDTK